MKIQEELNEFANKLEEFSNENSPKWLTPNSYFVAVKPGHNLDLLEISFDFRIDRTSILYSEAPEVLKDPSGADPKVIK